MSPRVEEDGTRDAIVVVPGIMGSELVDTTTGRTLWGLADASWYCSAWTFGGAIDDLLVTGAERDGDTRRVRATRLLRVPAFAPLLRGIEPYTALLAGLARVAAHPAAVAEFPYDWRLSVAHNARELATVAGQHLERWQAHPAGSSDARLVLVAHSMGGLVARYFTGVLGDAAHVRRTVTLGTPFYGAVKAAVILNSGRGAPLPLPRRRLRRLATTLPGVHDLLPSYRCVDDGTSARRLSPADVAALGGDAELARETFETRARLLAADGPAPHSLAGVEQRTAQSLVLRDGVVRPEYYTCEDTPAGLSRVDRMGDSTVFRDAAALVGTSPAPLPQRHGAIAKTAEAIAFVRAALTERPLGPPLAGMSALRLDLPDVVHAGEPFEVRVASISEPVGDPTGLACRIERADTMAPVAHPALHRADGSVLARATIGQPGVYRILVKGGGASAVSDLVMAVAATDLSEDE